MAITITGQQYITAPGSYSYSVSLDSGATIQSVDVYARTQAVRNKERNITNVQTLSNNSILIQLAGDGFGETYQIKVTERNSDESLSSATFNFFYSNVTTDPIVVNNNCVGTYMCSESTSSSPIRFLCTPGESITYKVRSADTVSLSSANTLQLNNVQISSETRYGVTEYTITGIVDSSTPVSTPGTTDNLTFNITIGNKTFYSTYTCLAPDYAFGTRWVYSEHEKTSYKGEYQVHNTTAYLDWQDSTIIYGHYPVGGTLNYSSSAPVWVNKTGTVFFLSPRDNSVTSGVIKFYSSSTTNCAELTCTKRTYAISTYDQEGVFSWVSDTESFSDLVYDVKGGDLQYGRLRLTSSYSWASVNANGELVLSANNTGSERSLDLVFYDAAYTDRYFIKHFTQTYAPNVVSEPATMTFNVTGGTTSYPIICTWNGCLYGFSSSANWVNVQDNNKKISVDANTGSNSRQSTLTSKCYSADPTTSSRLHEVSDSVTLTQEGLYLDFTSAGSDGEPIYSCAGGDYHTVITTTIPNASISFTSSAAWLTPTVQSGNYIFVVSPANVTGTSRTATITCTATDSVSGISATVTKNFVQDIAWVYSRPQSSDTQGVYLRRLPSVGTNNQIWTVYGNTSSSNIDWASNTNRVRFAFVGKNDGNSYGVNYSLVRSSGSSGSTPNWADIKITGFTSAPQGVDYVDLYLTPECYDSVSRTWVRNAGYENAWFRMYTKPAYINVSGSPKTVSYDTTSATFEFTYDTDQILSSLSDFRVSDYGNVTSYNIYTAGGKNYITINFNPNTSTSVKTIGGNLLVAESYDGTVVTISTPITITQETDSGTITVSPKTNEVNASAGVLNINILPEDMNLNSITYRVDSGNVTITNAFFNSDKTRAQFYYAANTSAVAEKSGTVTIYGTDIYGNTVSDSFSITQRKAQPTITVTPASNTVASNESPAVFTINHTGNLEFDYTATGDLSISRVTYTDVDATTTRFNVYLDANLGNTQKQGTLQITTDYYGSTVSSNQFTLTQKGLSGTVVVTPETKAVNGVAGSTTFTVSASNMDTLAASVDSSTISGITATLNQERTQLTVVYGTNAGSTDLSATIRVSGNDINGDTQYDTVQLTQHPKGTITINPSTTEVGFAAGTATVALLFNNIDVSSVSVSDSSDWVTTNYDANTRQVTLNYTDNVGAARTATITVTAIDIWGASISSTATLTQIEIGDVTINCSPISRTLTATEQMCQFYVNATPGITLNYSYTGNLDVDTTRTEIDVDRQTGEGYFKVYTNDNETSQLKTGVFVVTATYGGTTYRSNEMTVYKQGVGGSIILTPSSVEIPAWSGTMDIDVNHTNIDVDDMSAIIVSSTINNLSATLNADKTKLTIAWDGSTNTSEQSARISVRGTDYWGYNKYTVLEVTQVGVTPYIRLIPDVIDVPAKAGSVVLNVEYWGVDGNYYCNDVGTMSGSITIDRTNNTIRYTYNANTRRTPRRGELLTIDTITSTQESISTVGIINQAPGVIDSIKPVWNPDQINIMTENSFMEYHIDIADNIVYAGKIYKQPDSDVISFNIGDVASNYLHNGLTFSEGLNLIPDYVKDFKIVTNEATEYNQTIYNSWAYEDTDYWLSEPIDYRISCKQWLPVSFISTNYREINVNNQAYYANRVNKGWTVMQNLRNYNVGNDILVYGADGTTRSYKIADGDYVLYYANAFGGWDSLLCNATSKKTDNIESLNYRKKSYSRDEFSKIDYQKNITPTWTMNTGIIKSGDKMHHLLESTMVYLHKLETDEIIPVVVTNSTCDYLNYTNNGKRPCTYQITVEESNQKLRK